MPGAPLAAPMRLAGPADAELAGRLLAGLRAWLGRTEPSAQAFAARVAALIPAGQHEFILWAGTGICALSFRETTWSDGGGVCCIEDLYVEGRERGRGIGRALVLAAIDRARKRSCYRIELDVSRANLAALAFYQGLGFTWIDDDFKADNLVLRIALQPGLNTEPSSVGKKPTDTRSGP